MIKISVSLFLEDSQKYIDGTEEIFLCESSDAKLNTYHTRWFLKKMPKFYGIEASENLGFKKHLVIIAEEITDALFEEIDSKFPRTWAKVS